MSDEYTPTTAEVRGDYAGYPHRCAGICEHIERADDFDLWLAEHDREVAEEAWDEGQKSGMRYTDRMRAAYEIGRPELPGPPSLNPYREGATS